MVLATTAEGGEETYAYDANGNEIRYTDAEGNVTETLYDAVNRKISEITIASNSTRKSRSVVFYGEYGGVKKMKNRNLPDIEIIELSKEGFLEKE